MAPGQISPSPIDFHRRPYNTLALPCECVIVFTALCYASAVLAMALCLSVRLSVTSQCSTKIAKRRITQTTPHDSPWILAF